jgi:hypothetical protein
LRPTVILTVHAEALERDDVWRRVLRVVRSMGRREMAGTFFVYPFPATVAGADISSRVSFLLSSGQEIGQHTHFYSGDRIGQAEKTNDLSDENVRHCITRDRETLGSMGTTPRGFLAGAWHVTPAVLDVLTTTGFSYDCSARLPVLGRADDGADLEWLDKPRIESRRPGASLVRVPTTSSLGEWFRRWGRGVSVDGSQPFQIVYFHDYELLRRRTRWMLEVFLRLNRRRLTPLGEFVDGLVPEVIA